MDCFHFLNDDKNWNVCRFHTSVIGFSIPVQLPVSFKFLILVFQQRQHEHYADNSGKNAPSEQSVCVCVYVRLKTLKQKS